MSDILNRDVVIEIPCQKCGHKVPLSLRELEKDPVYTCPECNVEIHLNGSELKQSLGEVEEQLQKLKDTLSSFKM